MRELAVFLDGARRLRALGEASVAYLLRFSVFAIFVLLALIATRTIELLPGVGLGFERYYGLFVLGFLVMLAIGGALGWLYVNRKLDAFRPSEPPILGGLPAALKYLSELDMEASIEDVRKAVFGLSVYAVARLSYYWMWGYFFTALANSVLYGLIYIRVDNGLLAVLSLILAVVVGRKDLIERFDAVWTTRALIEELRWFYTEFKGAKFEA